MVDWARVRRQFLGDLFGDEAGAGSTTTTVVASLRRAVLGAMGVWQLMMVLTIVIEPTPVGERAAGPQRPVVKKDMSAAVDGSVIRRRGRQISGDGRG